MAELPRHRLGDIQRKVLTLHTLRALGECGNLQLIRFMVENDIMNYFDLQTALYELRDAGQVARTPLAADDLYQLTQAGEDTLGMFLHHAPQSLVDRIDQTAPGFRALFDAQREKHAYISHEGQNEYHVTMEITEQRMPLMRIDLSLPTAELAARFRDRWLYSAQDIYDFIIKRLAQEDNE